jgi:FkbM family methyltransferase
VAASSVPRDVVKRLLHRRTRPRTYERAVAVGKAVDIGLGRWREPELELLEHVVRPGDVTFDVGANYGLYSYHLSRLVAPHGRVYAFEPVPAVNRALGDVRRLLRMRNVTVVPLGAADVEGEAVFESPVAASGAIVGGLSRMRRGDGPSAPGLVTTSVRTTRLDAFAAREGIRRVALIKCDIEGAEFFAMRGAVGLLAQRPLVICEIGRGLLRERYGIAVEDLLDLFSEHGLQAWRWEPVRVRLVPADFSTGHDGNYVFADPALVERLV